MNRIKILFFILPTLGLKLQSQTTVTFNLEGVINNEFKYVGVRGSAPPLSWDETIRLDKRGNAYSGSVEFENDIADFEFKYVLYNSEKNVQWESLNNREVSLEGSPDIVLDHQWNTYPEINISELKKIPSSSLMEDFALIKTMVLEVHPGVYRYNTKSQILAGLNKLEEAFQNDLTHGEAYLAISELLGQIQCDHTFASFYNQGPILKSIIHNQKDKLPFSFTWVDGKMIVLRNASERTLERGTEIIGINGISTDEILNTLIKYAKADGATDKSRIKQLEVSGYPYRYNAFDVYHPLVYPVKDNFTVEVKYPDGQMSQMSLAPVTREKRAKTLAARYIDFPVSKEMLWGYEKLQDDVGLFKAGTFDDFGMDRDWNKYFKETFAKIRKDGIKYLIVDLRKNQGGFDEIGAGLIRHLMKQAGSLQDYIDKTRFKVFPEPLKPYAQSWGEPWYYNPELIGGPDELGYYERPRYLEPKVKPAKNAFKGEVFFLVGPKNVSMAYYLATGIKKNEVGLLIGEETGGNQKGINGGQLLFLRLPNSKIEIDVPIVGSFSLNDDAPNSGVIPDIKVSAKVEDIIAGRDIVLIEAMKQIEILKSENNR